MRNPMWLVLHNDAKSVWLSSALHLADEELKDQMRTWLKQVKQPGRGAAGFKPKGFSAVAGHFSPFRERGGDC